MPAKPVVKRSQRREETDTRPRRGIGYVRVSAKGGRSGPEYRTLDIQKDSIRRKAAALGIELVGEIVVEENKSGRDKKRPRFRAAMERIMAGEADCMIVWKVSRFSRSWSQAAVDVETLVKAGKALVSGEEDVDTETIGGRMMLKVLFMIADWEADVFGEQWSEIKDRVFEAGVHLGRTPYGYRRIRRKQRASGESHPKDVTLDEARELLEALGSDREPVSGALVPCPVEAPIVVELFEKRRAGWALADLTRWLNERTSSGKTWRQNEVKRILVNTVYVGDVEYGDEEKGSKVIVENAHEAIVSKQLFLAVQEAIQTRPYRRGANEYPLSGLVYCAACSQRMGGQAPTAGYRVYRCARTECSARSTVSADRLEAIVRERADELLETPVLRRRRSGASPVVELDRRIVAVRANLDDMMTADARLEHGGEWSAMVSRMRRELNRLVADRQLALVEAGHDSADLQAGMSDEDFYATLRSMGIGIVIRKLPRGSAVERRVWVAWDGIDGLGGDIGPFPFPEG